MSNWILAGIAADPAAATALGDTLLAKVSGAAHFHAKCNGCAGAGKVRCQGCANGRVPCSACQSSGTGICFNCHGSGTACVSVQGYDGFTVSTPQPCPSCLTSPGRDGICYTCWGAGAVQCGRCNGSAWVGCGSCDATGWFTYLGTAKIYSSIERSLKFPDDAPPTFAAYLTQHGVEWCRDNADYILARSINDNGRGWVTIAGAAPYAKMSFVVAGQSFLAEAFGTRAEVALLPPFLDLLLQETFEAIKRPRADVADWFGGVQESGLLKQLFDQISSGSQEAVEASYLDGHGAASRELLAGTDTAIKAGLKRVGRRTIERTWLVGLLVAVLAVPLVAASGFWGEVADSARPFWAMALAPLVVLLPTWLTAHLLWRKAATMAFGKTPAHGPQYWWRLVPLTILLAAWNVGAVGSLYARGWGEVAYMGYGGRLVAMGQNAAAFLSTLNAGRLAKLWADAFHAPVAPQAQPPQSSTKPSPPTAVKATKKPKATYNNSSGNTAAPVPAPSVATAGGIKESVRAYSSPSPENTEAPSPDANANVRRFRNVLLGTWRGTYICGQGQSTADLVISDVTDQGVLHGTFHFFNMPNRHHVRPGEYTVSATFHAPRNGFSFTPVKWVQAPPGYSMVGFNVRLGSENKLIGRITSSGCQGISLEK